MVRVEEQVGAQEVGLKAAVAPVGSPEAENVRVGGAPEVRVSVTVEVVDWPGLTDPEDGDREMSNLNAVTDRS